MSFTPDFEVVIELVELDGETLIFDLSDTANGYWIVDHTPADESMDFNESDPAFVNGVFENSGKDAAGRYAVLLKIEGDSWPQVEARRLALRTAYRSETHYLLRITVQGVATTYRARRPDASFGTLRQGNLINNFRRVLLSFPVQPNPTVTGV